MLTMMTMGVVLIVPVVEGKKVSGSFKLSGENSESVLTSFAVVPTGARLSVNLTTGSQMYEDEHYLRFHMFQDTEWPRFLKALTCEDKVKYSMQQQRVSFEFRNNAWTTSRAITADLKPPLASDKNMKNNFDRPHYWYAVVTDCSLEMGYQRDGKIPTMHYELEIVNILAPQDDKINNNKNAKEGATTTRLTTHLSADELQLTTLHFVTMIVSSSIVLYLIMHITFHLSKQHTVHAVVLWVLAAAALDSGSSLLEIIHLRIYDQNGIGSYLADALSAHLEALCDAFLALLLLTIGAGWTLPSDVVMVNPNESVVQKLVSNLAKPLTNLGSSSSGGGSHGATILGLVVIAFHVILAQWGRTYDENFESYHDLEHLPGQVLMIFRIFCGFLLVIATVQTRIKCKSGHLKTFYVQLCILGLLWFLSLPILSWFCTLFVPYYLRHPAVFMGAAICQEMSLLLFAWLVTSHSTLYHQISHMTTSTKSTTTAKSGSILQRNTHEGSFTDALSSSAAASTSNSMGMADTGTWKMGKAKFRLD